MCLNSFISLHTSRIQKRGFLRDEWRIRRREGLGHGCKWAKRYGQKLKAMFIELLSEFTATEPSINYSNVHSRARRPFGSINSSISQLYLFAQLPPHEVDFFVGGNHVSHSSSISLHFPYEFPISTCEYVS